MKKLVNNYDDILTDEDKLNIINDYVNNLYSIRRLVEKYNVRSKEYIRKLLGDNIRSISEGNKVAHKLYPDSFKHSEKTKKIMSEKRKQFMKEHPEKTAWRLKNMSYPEKCFQKFLEDNGYDKKYLIIRERPVFPYYIDFAFEDVKIAVEIDGSQHEDEHRKQRDVKKDNLLQENGWRVIRISENAVKTDWSIIKTELDKYLNNVDYYNPDRVGIFTHKSPYTKKERNERGYTSLEEERMMKQRRVERPEKDEMVKLISSLSLVQIGNMYGVSDNAIRGWLKWYNLPYKYNDITKFLRENNIVDNRKVVK